jgi:sulfide:quinone oxidoreductase
MNSTNSSDGRHKVLIVGGGSAGLTLAARLRRSGLPDVAVLEPSDSHYYQPLWTLVGGGGRRSAPRCGRSPVSCRRG